MLTLTHRLPRVKGAGRLPNILRVLYLRKRRAPVRPTFRGFDLLLDPHEFVDGWLLFGPQFYEDAKLEFLRGHLRPGATFVDLGAHIGLYSLIASRLVGPTGTVLALEADPSTYQQLTLHLEWNAAGNVRSLCVGVSDRVEHARLTMTSTTNRAANSFIWGGSEGVDVECRPLADIVWEQGITRIDGAKFDIEGYEHRVLAAFFRSAPKELYPGFVLTEFFADWMPAAGGDTLDLLRRHGYRHEATFRVAGKAVNFAFSRPSP